MLRIDGLMYDYFLNVETIANFSLRSIYVRNIIITCTINDLTTHYYKIQQSDSAISSLRKVLLIERINSMTLYCSRSLIQVFLFCLIVTTKKDSSHYSFETITAKKEG